MRKSVFLMFTACAISVAANAQTEQFRIAAYNNHAITIGKESVSIGAVVGLDDTIRWPSDDAALKLYGTTHKKMYLVAAEMKKNEAHTIAQYLARTAEKQTTEAVQQRHTTTRTFGVEEVADTLYLLDTLAYRLPEELQDEGILELHIHDGENKFVVPTGQQVSLGGFVIGRNAIPYASGEYEASIWIKNEGRGWNYPIARGLHLVILPKNEM